MQTFPSAKSEALTPGQNFGQLQGQQNALQRGASVTSVSTAGGGRVSARERMFQRALEQKKQR